MNIFLHEWNLHKKETAGWTFSVLLISVLMLAMYPLVNKDLNTYLTLLDRFPAQVKEAMGIVTSILSTPLGYYTFIFTTGVLFAALFGMNLGAGILSRETRDKTADFLLTKPVSRTRILAMKILAGCACILAFTVVYFAGIYAELCLLSDSGPDFQAFALLCAAFFLTLTLFFSLGLFLSSLIKKLRSTLPLSFGVTLLFYGLSAFAVNGADDKLRYLTPFQYFRADRIVQDLSFELPYFFLSLLLIFALIGLTFPIFLRKDIHAV